MKDSIDHIILPEMVIAGLYRQTLVMPHAAPGNIPATVIAVRTEDGDTAPGDVPAAAIAVRTENSDVAPDNFSVTATPPPSHTPTAEAEKETTRGPQAREGMDISLSKEARASHRGQAGEAAAHVIAGAASATQAYRVLGNNSKKVAVIVHFPEDAFLTEQHLQFLGKILGACKMNLGDIAIVNHAVQPIVIGQLKQQLQPAYILLFGPAPTDIQLPLNFTPFKQQQYDGCQYLYVPSLNELNQEGEQARQLKGQLWTCLKKMFDI